MGSGRERRELAARRIPELEASDAIGLQHDGVQAREQGGLVGMGRSGVHRIFSKSL
jgi:hypothetical protein